MSAFLTQNDIDRIADETGDILRKEKKVTIMISDKNLGDYWEGCINGHVFRIATGIQVEVPESLARLIEQNSTVMRAAESIAKKYQGEGKKVG